MPTAAAPRIVYFIRHGTSEWNLLGKWQGQTDTLLAPEGEEQARSTGAALHASEHSMCQLAHGTNAHSLRISWRLALPLGVLPEAIALSAALTLPRSPFRIMTL